MRIRWGILATATIFPVVASAAPVQPVPGIYSESDYVLAEDAFNGGTCPLSFGLQPIEYFQFPGVGKPGAILRQGSNTSGFFEVFVGTATKTTTQPGNKAVALGNFKLVPAVTGGSGLYKSELQYTFIDAYSFMTTSTLSTYTNAGYTSASLLCTMSLQSIYLFTGTKPLG